MEPKISSHNINSVSHDVCLYELVCSKDVTEEITDMEQILSDKIERVSKFEFQVTGQNNDMEKDVSKYTKETG